MNSVKIFKAENYIDLELAINRFIKQGNVLVNISLAVSKHEYHDWYIACVVYHR